MSGDSGCSLSHPLDCNAFAVACGHEVLLIDTGRGVDTEALLHNLESDGIAANRITTLLLTHAHLDDAGGACWLHEKLGLRVIASTEVATGLMTADEEATSLGAARRARIYPLDMKWRLCPAAHVIEKVEGWTVGDVVMHAVHTPGSLARHAEYLVQTPESLLAFTGDTVFHGGRIALQDFPIAFLRNTQRACALAAWPIDGLFHGNGVWSLTRGLKQIALSLPHLDRLLLPPNAF